MTKHIHAQPSLFRRAARDQQAVSYTPGPNPDLGRFVEEHGTPYDPVDDDYDAPPFDKPITSTKATAIYNMHTYQSKKPHGAIQEYIRHYTRVGDLVLDPLCGSGGTVLAALMEGRKAVAIDLSPAATFITKNYCTTIDVAELKREFKELQATIKSEMDWLYETRCDRCDGRASTVFTVYSYVFQCSRCLEKTPLFDCIEVQGQTAKGKPKTISVCPSCYERGQKEEISTRSNRRFDPVPVMVVYECRDGCTPKQGQRQHKDPDAKKREFFENYDLRKLTEIETREIPHWVPPHRMMNVESDTEPWGDKWRAGTSSFRTVAELYTKRNLWAMAAIRHAAQQVKYSDFFLFGLTGISLAVSRMQRYSPTSTFPNMILTGTYYVPQIGREHNVGNWYAGKIRSLLKGLKAIELNSSDLVISTQSATHMGEIGPNTVDYIFTDPPYSHKVQYGELNFVWEAWLNLDTHWHDEEIIVNKTRNRTERDWERMMYQAMEECYRVLKPGRWL